MKKLVLGLVVCCGVASELSENVMGMQAVIDGDTPGFTRQKRSHSDSDIYATAKKKISWALPKNCQSQTTDDIDQTLRYVGASFSHENLHNLFEKITKNPSYTNYVHLMFDECYSGNFDWKFAYVSSVLSHAAVCYGLQRTFNSAYLDKMLRDSIEADDWGLKS